MRKSSSRLPKIAVDVELLGIIARPIFIISVLQRPNYSISGQESLAFNILHHAQHW
jgi:hypothetical protein